MRMKILILEDDKRRVEAMMHYLRDASHPFEPIVFDNSTEMVRFLDGNLQGGTVISLDHDLPLYRDAHGQLHDFGTGRDVADYLSNQEATCPVVIHSTNSPAAVGMEMALIEGGWTTYRIMPYGDLEWVAELWFPTIKHAIFSTGK